MPLTVRVDTKTERLIERLARKRGRTKSEVVREAIGAFAKQAEDHNEAESPYEAVRDLIGIVQDGPSDLSVQTGKRISPAYRDFQVYRPAKLGRFSILPN